jgi:anti-sigma regulatory factor (Ser/Thr protein kinase)
MHDHKTFPARIECLESMIAWVRERIQNSLFREADQRKIELALEEALVNVILHAYPQPSRKAIL